ncbi:hypothetical protein SAMN06273572_10728 [Monaibacterium marinum]|uniref:Porin n=1 Tax=Pontivivens marinum TaxID=1690039 RepID=A0A2C9CUS6_9RHOB|nr:hypothetical protein [Monaibacterium marinum]SOH95007.1 hypothetical protein SAMN06273572_10728 [Monaibacterium marinum]
MSIARILIVACATAPTALFAQDITYSLGTEVFGTFDGSDTNQKSEFQPRLSFGLNAEHRFANGLEASLHVQALARIGGGGGDLYVPEATLDYTTGGYDLMVGTDIESWGVTEAAELTDILNQVDLDRNLAGDTRLGQPTLRVSHLSDWGWVAAYYLPYTPERPYAGVFGLDALPVTYETSQEEWEPGFALRYAHNMGDYDFGGFVFHGLDRSPSVIAGAGGPELLYPITTQIGAYGQISLGSTFLRAEVLHNSDRVGFDGTIRAELGYTVEVEHEIYGLLDGQTDLALLAAYTGNSRDDSVQLLQDDFSLGAKLTWNTIASPELTLLATMDAGNGTSFVTLGYERRINDAMTVELEAVTFFNVDDTDTLSPLDDAGYIRAAMTYRF